MTDVATIERSIVIDAPAASIAPHITDLHRWQDWSPWEGQDPALERTYTGEPGTVGSTYAWKGNRRAGAGSMEVSRITPTEIGIDLAFTAPFKSTSKVAYRLTETGATTEVVWSMTTPQNLMAKVMGFFINMDKMLGRDFEKGLAQLKTVVESEHHTD
jgi:hypothetical protein